MYRLFVMQCLCALAISLPIAPVHAYDWLQFGGDAQHSGRNTAETSITPNNVSALVQKYQVTLAATADGAPVFLEAVSTPIGIKDLLFVTTRDGRIIAIDAQTGAQVWTHAIRLRRRQSTPIGSMSTATVLMATSTSIRSATAAKSSSGAGRSRPHSRVSMKKVRLPSRSQPPMGRHISM
jgi:glucose dehydrogenase